VLVRKVLLPPMLAGAAIACLLGALALTVAGGSRAGDRKSLFAGDDGGKLVDALSIELEGTPGAGDIRAARLPRVVRKRLLERHPFYASYMAAQQRYGVPWVLVAAVDYQETGFGRRAKRKSSRRAIMQIGRQLRDAKANDGLGKVAVRAVSQRYGSQPQGDVSTAMVIERARAWRLVGTIPLPGRGELLVPTTGIVGGCGYFGCPRPGHLHNGVDYLAPSGTPIHAADEGEVVLMQSPGESGGYGNFTCVQHRPHLASCYAHQSAFAAGLRVGSRVKRGELIGLVGSTGSSTAPHLHFEVRRGPAACQSCAVDPLPLLSDEAPEATVPKILRLPGAARSAPAAPAPTGPGAPAPVRAAPVQAAPAPTATAPREKPEENEEPETGTQPTTPKGSSGAQRGGVPDFDPAPGLDVSTQAAPAPQPPPPAAPASAAPAPAPAAPAAAPATGGASGPPAQQAAAAPAP